MIIGGAKVSGVKYAGQRILSSIGDVIYWLDHRQLVNAAGDGERVTSWGSLASNYGLSGANSIPGQGPRYYEGFGVGWDYSLHGVSNGVMRSSDAVIRSRFLSGEKYALFCVAYKSNNGSVANEATDLVAIRNESNTTDAYRWRPVFRPGTQSLYIGGETEEQLSAMGNAEYNLIGAVYYGAGKANNVRLIGRDSLQTSTNSVSMPITDAGISYLFRFGGSNLLPVQFVKLSIAYNLNHLTDDNINNVFLPLFYATLKEDAEYSSLVTP